MENVADLIQSAADWLFVPVLVIVLFGTALLMSVRLGFVQIRRFPEAVREFFGGRARDAEGALSPFQAFMTALAATIGTGNIAGVAAGIAALTTTPFTQTNSIALVMNTQVGVPLWVSGVVVAVLTWLVIIGGIKSIGRAAETLAPLKVGLYLLGSLVVIVTFAGRIPEVLAMVFREAFTTNSALGFGVFTAMRYGLARGLYANEAGYGTAAVAYGTAQSDRPSQQGLNAVMEVIIVSFGTCTLTAMTVLLSGVIDWSVPVAQRATSTAAVALAFDSAMPGFGGYVVAFCVFLFGYGTLIGWAFYGEQFLTYWLGNRVVMPYRWIYCLLIPFGAVAKVNLVWAWGDLMNALQIFPNLIGVIALSGIAAKAAFDRKR